MIRILKEVLYYTGILIEVLKTIVNLSKKEDSDKIDKRLDNINTMINSKKIENKYK